MTISRVTIANMALSHIGAKSNIESLSEGSAESNVCNLWYDHARRKTLEMYDWNFARKRLTLSAHTDDPPDGVWAYRYQYPSDCVRFRYIENPFQELPTVFGPPHILGSDAVPFEVATDEDGTTRSILTDMSEAVGVYTFDLEDENMFSSTFVDALSYMIASRIAFSITGKANLKEDMRRSAVIEIQTAAANSHNESVAKAPRDTDWIRVRG